MDWVVKMAPYYQCIMTAALMGLLMQMILKKQLGQAKLKYIAFMAVGIAVVYLARFGPTWKAYGSILIGMLLLYAAVYDYETHLVPDYVHILLLLAGVTCSRPIPGLIGMLLVPFPFFIAALLKEDSIGGADIKLMGACGYLLGLRLGYAALLMGLSLAVLVRNARHKPREEPFALVPYLTVGCLVMMLGGHT